MEILRYQHVLHLLQRFGDLNPKILGTITGERGAPNSVERLRKFHGLELFPLESHEALGLSMHCVFALSKPSLSLMRIYNVLGSFAYSIYRDVLDSERLLIFLQWPKGDLNFIKVLERMREKGWIYDYDFHAVAKRTFYPQDFSSLDFNSKLLRFELLEKPKEPFSLPPLWDGFKPDWFDVNLIGKRQEEPRLNLKQVANTLGIPYRVALRHWQEHVVGRGLVSGYNVWFLDISARVILIFEKSERVEEELARIPSLKYTIELDNGLIYASVFAQNHFLLDLLRHVSEVSKFAENKINVVLSPIKPTFEYSILSSIPYEHFSKNGKWEVNVERMVEKVDSLDAKPLQESVSLGGGLRGKAPPRG